MQNPFRFFREPLRFSKIKELFRGSRGRVLLRGQKSYILEPSFLRAYTVKMLVVLYKVLFKKNTKNPYTLEFKMNKIPYIIRGTLSTSVEIYSKIVNQKVSEVK